MQLPEWRLIERDAAQARLALVVPAGHPCFAGHFPGRPILPGVVQIDWAIRLAELNLGGCAPFYGLGPVKFMRVIGPGAELALELRRDAERGSLSFSYAEGDTTCSSGRVLFGDAAR